MDWDPTTAPSDMIGVPREPAGLQEETDMIKYGFSDPAVIGRGKLSFLTASTRNGITNFFQL